ncbi:MAG: chitobiase/beta-hexosaminidase C-terminal domain-containing protein, partial [Muribaculaceae bacterium]|nr:chitobiase/beta-hexosaminidase C-terminal domain-containing protein [Muribaculaceae bacterium]
LALNEDGSKFMASDSIKIGAFSAYICLNEGTTAQEFPVGEHAIWVQEPYGAGVSGTKLYRGDKIELTTKTKNATIYYTTDGSDPSDAEGTRMVYDAPIDMIGESMSLQAMAVFKDFSSENVDLNFELKKVDIDYDLAPNWNWISHNMENEVAVADFATEGISRILSQTQEVVRDPKLGLSGNLKTLLPGTGYKVCVASEKNAAAKIAGVAFNPQGAVKLHSGWNWIGCPVDDASLAVADLLANLEAEEGDMIVGLEGFQQADAEGNWTGTLPVLATGAGYLYFSNSDKEFTYNFVKGEPAEASAEEPATRTLEETPWVVDIHRYANVMPMTAVAVDADGFDADVEDYMIAAFCGKECRGIAQVVDGKYMINIHGNAGDNISFRFINAEGAEYVTSSNIIFKELPVGSVSEPYVIKLNILSAVNSIEADGLEIVSENGAIVVKGDLAGNASVEVFDLAGNRLAASSANNGAVSVNGLEPGIRLIVVRTGSDIIYRKVMVK